MIEILAVSCLFLILLAGYALNAWAQSMDRFQEVSEAYDKLSVSYTAELKRSKHWHKLYEKRTNEATR